LTKELELKSQQGDEIAEEFKEIEDTK